MRIATNHTCRTPDDPLDALAARLAEPIARRVVELLTQRESDGSAHRWLDTAAAAEYLGINRDTLRKLAAARTVPSEQEAPGCKRYFRRSDLDYWRQNGGGPARLRSAADRAGFHAASMPAKSPSYTIDSV